MVGFVMMLVGIAMNGLGIWSNWGTENQLSLVMHSAMMGMLIGGMWVGIVLTR